MEDEIGNLTAKWRNEDCNDIEQYQQAQYISDKKIIIIGGCARSGTTLMRVMLDSHSKLLCGPHTNLFIPIKVNPDHLAHQTGVAIDNIHKVLASFEDRAEFISHFSELILPIHGKEVFCDKTARNILLFDWITTHFPNAKIIHVVRDGLDVICSLRTHRKRKLTRNEIVDTGIRMPLDMCIERWVNTIEKAIRHRGHENYYEVKYEDLVLDTEQTLKGVCRFLNIPYEQMMLKYYEFKGPTRDPYKFIQNIEATKPIFTTSIERWRKELTTDELDFVLSKIQGLRNQLGYDRLEESN